MKTFEYLITETDIDISFNNYLNELGKERWELVQADKAIDRNDPSKQKIIIQSIFKRELNIY